jgi:aminopeptidase N
MPAFMRWYSQAGTPEVVANGHWDAAKQTYRLDVAQAVPATPGQPVKAPMVIPLAVGLVGADGRDLALALSDGKAVERGVLTLTKPAESFVFTGISARPVASFNRGFSAPIKLIANLSSDDLGFLAARDNDPFNRWQAVQALAIELLVADATAQRLPEPEATRDHLIAALAEIVADIRLEPGFVAQTLTLPGEADIAREIGQDINPDAIFRARTLLRATIGQRLGVPLLDTYVRMTDRRPYRPDAESAGRRALKNICLDLLAAAGKSEAIERVVRQYQDADNMTDRMAALATLSLHAVPQRAQAIEDFYRRYSDDPLITDKWFALQASIPEPQTLERVQSLTAHPAFSLTNPNRARALIGVFAQGNPTQFNRADGAGYDFVVDKVLTLDEKNPQVAARLLSAFKSWRALESSRRGQAEAALQRVAATHPLSHDVSDIVRRTLAPSPSDAKPFV